MKFHKKIAFLFTYWWVMALVALGLAPFLLGNHEGTVSEQENRFLQGLPELNAATWFGGEFASQLEGFLSDQMPGRTELLGLSASILNVLDTRTDEEIIMNASVGKELEAAGEMNLELEQEEAVQELPDEQENDFLTQVDTVALPKEQEAVAMDEEETGELPQERQENIFDEESLEDQEEEETLPVVEPGSVGDISKVHSVFYRRADGSEKPMFHFGEIPVRSVIKALNAYRDALPEDGNVYFSYIPDSQRADVWLLDRKNIVGWHSDVEEAMQANVKPGVHVYSAVNILEPYMQAEEPVFYLTDHHWTGLGAYYLIKKIMEDRGVPVVRYEDFAYTIHENFHGSIYQSALAMAKTGVSDRLEVPTELLPVYAAEYQKVNHFKKEVRYMEPERGSYSSYLGGTHTPFFVVETGFHTGRNAVVISDSFGNAFIPYLVPYYDKVCQIDLRGENPFVKDGHKVREYLDYWKIDDVYFVVSNGNGINATYMRVNARKYL